MINLQDYPEHGMFARVPAIEIEGYIVGKRVNDEAQFEYELQTKGGEPIGWLLADEVSIPVPEEELEKLILDIQFEREVNAQQVHILCDIPRRRYGIEAAEY